MGAPNCHNKNRFLFTKLFLFLQQKIEFMLKMMDNIIPEKESDKQLTIFPGCANCIC